MTRHNPYLVLVAGLLLAMPACDSAEAPLVEGLWRSTSTSSVTYLSIGRAEVAFYQNVEAEGQGDECYVVTELEVASVSGDTFVVRRPERPEEAWRMTLKVEGDELTVVFEDEAMFSAERYERMSWAAAELSPQCAR